MMMRTLFLSTLFIFMSIGIVLGIFVTGGLYFMRMRYTIDLTSLEHTHLLHATPTRILDRSGLELMRFTADKREIVEYNQLPSNLINAFLAAEDWHFFSHPGISTTGIIRSLLVNIYYGRTVQGASTITQQLVKMLFLNAEKTLRRKIKEQLYAILIEIQYSKEYILQMYLNTVCFGCGIYGVQAAAQRFWGKSVDQLSLSECAALAGIVRRPSFYCPLTHPLNCEQRRNVVLTLMHRRGCISLEERDAAMMPLTTNTPPEHPDLFHVREMIRQSLEKKVGREKLYKGGLVVQTTLDRGMQESAFYEFKKQCVYLRASKKMPIDGGLVALDRKTGAIRAVVGGIDFKTSQFNRALFARRQMGSIFKPLIYALAIEQGKTFADIEIDEQYCVESGAREWRPNNYDNTFQGPITLAYALSHSNNIVTIKLLQQVGIEAVITRAQKTNLQGPLPPYPSLALGCVDATLLESTAFFNVFANNGMFVSPYLVEWIRDSSGAKIETHVIKPVRIFESKVADQVAKVLMLGLKRVRGLFNERWLEAQALGKTGTTNDWRTCWFIGSTPEITTGIYVGCDDNRSLGAHMYPVRTALPIWLRFNRRLPVTKPCFDFDPYLKEAVVHGRTGVTTHEQDPQGLSILLSP